MTAYILLTILFFIGIAMIVTGIIGLKRKLVCSYCAVPKGLGLGFGHEDFCQIRQTGIPLWKKA